MRILLATIASFVIVGLLGFSSPAFAGPCCSSCDSTYADCCSNCPGGVCNVGGNQCSNTCYSHYQNCIAICTPTCMLENKDGAREAVIEDAATRSCYIALK
jgi:hypothetical protein